MAIVSASHLSGADLRARRKAMSLTQTELARRAGCGRGTVAYWEGKPVLDVRGGVCRRLAEIVGLYGYECNMRRRASARVRSLTPEEQRAVAEHLARQAQRDAIEHARDARRTIERALRADTEARRTSALEAQQAARRRVPCKALTRRGTPCAALSEPGRTRCRFHGGKSTGPQTPEGRARIAKAQRQRWAAWRAQREASEIDTKERTS